MEGYEGKDMLGLGSAINEIYKSENNGSSDSVSFHNPANLKQTWNFIYEMRLGAKIVGTIVAVADFAYMVNTGNPGLASKLITPLTDHLGAGMLADVVIGTNLFFSSKYQLDEL
ncbi:MAG: hypothetical protein ACTSU7_09910 [Candidatus Heimdallarchaeaceae archaeon]